jgi:phosphatidate phosphatase APP1
MAKEVVPALRMLAAAEDQFDRLKFKLKQKLGALGPVRILPFRGYGTRQRLWIRGRVLEDSGISDFHEHADTWENLLNMWRRYESDEIPGAQLELRVGSRRLTLETDAEGYFDKVFDIAEPDVITSPWTRVEIRLLKPIAGQPLPKPVRGDILVPSEQARFGIISDLDDTVIKTGATSLFRHLRTVLLNNAGSREPFSGVAPLYQALHKGVRGKSFNPVFYVSSSPWNIYDLFEDFLDIHDIPAGPILLKDMGLDKDKFIKTGHDAYKHEQIAQILTTYPALGFILIGDSGQRDAWIYRRIVRDFPGRILAVYMRNLTPEKKNNDVLEIQQELQAQVVPIPLLLVQDSVGAARHACQQGWISKPAVKRVERAVTDK